MTKVAENYIKNHFAIDFKGDVKTEAHKLLSNSNDFLVVNLARFLVAERKDLSESLNPYMKIDKLKIKIREILFSLSKSDFKRVLVNFSHYDLSVDDEVDDELEEEDQFHEEFYACTKVGNLVSFMDAWFEKDDILHVIEYLNNDFEYKLPETGTKLKLLTSIMNKKNKIEFSDLYDAVEDIVVSS